MKFLNRKKRNTIHWLYTLFLRLVSQVREGYCRFLFDTFFWDANFIPPQYYETSAGQHRIQSLSGSFLIDYLFWWNNKGWQGTGALPDFISFHYLEIREYASFRWCKYHKNLQIRGKSSQLSHLLMQRNFTGDTFAFVLKEVCPETSLIIRLQN